MDKLKSEVLQDSAETVKIITTEWIEECAKIVNDNKEKVDLPKENEDEVIRNRFYQSVWLSF